MSASSHPSTLPGGSAESCTGRRRNGCELPDYLVPLGRTMGFGANGSVSNLAPFPAGGVVAPRRLVRSGEFDVIHVHEPVVPLVGWNATLGAHDPVVGTFHTYSTKPLPNYIANALGARRVFNRLAARIAVSEAAAWTGRRWYGGEYTIIPNGVDVDAAPDEPKPAGPELRILFVGRSEERKGLPILLTAFNALVEHVPCRLTVIGADREEVLRYIADPELLRVGRHPRPGLARGALARAAPRRPALRALALRRELRDGPDRGLRRGHAGDRLGDRRLQRRRQRRRRRPARPARRPAAPGRGAAAGPLRAGAPAGDGGGRPAQRPALRLAAGRRPGHRRLRAGDRGAEAGDRRREGRPLGRPAARRRPAEATRRAASLARPAARPGGEQGAGRRPPARPRRGRDHGRRADPAGGAEDRRRQGRRKHRPLEPDLGPDRLRADGELPLLPRRVLVLDRPRRPAQPPGAPPRRHLGDDDRGADVGDPARPPRGAGARADARPPHRSHAGNVPGAARDPGLADDAEPRRPGPARGDHRLDHAALPLGDQADLRLQPGAAAWSCSWSWSRRC